MGACHSANFHSRPCTLRQRKPIAGEKDSITIAKYFFRFEFQIQKQLTKTPSSSTNSSLHTSRCHGEWSGDLLGEEPPG